MSEEKNWALKIYEASIEKYKNATPEEIRKSIEEDTFIARCKWEAAAEAFDENGNPYYVDEEGEKHYINLNDEL